MGSVTRRDALALTLAAAAPAGWAKAAERASFPFKVTRNVAWTGVTLEGQRPLPFMLDSGANNYLIDPAAAEKAGLRRTGEVASAETAGGRVALPVYNSREIVIGGALRDVNVSLIGLKKETMDLTQGIVPSSTLASVGFDFDAERVSVARELAKAPEGYERVDMANQSTQGFSHLQHSVEAPQPVIHAELDGQPVRLMLDTGANDTLVLFGGYVRRHGLWDHYAKVLPGRARTVGGLIGLKTVRAEVLRVGQVSFKGLPIALSDPASQGRGNDWSDGLIGLEVLRRLNFIIAPERRSVFFKPSKDIDDVYRYDRAGLSIERVQESIQVVHVAAGGPAARAGFRLGDHVTGWAGQGGYFGLVWALQGAPGDVVRIQVERNGQPEVLAVTLEERI